MCGILGVLSVGPSAGGPESAADVARWRDRMAARGPDGAGQTSILQGGWSATLAHRRLAVVEPGPAGHQPLWSHDHTWAIVYNGELYNDAAVRAEIGDRWSFRTRSDTETVLAAIATWGLDAATRLRGMYALAALHTKTGDLYLARDPMGIKPLFTAERDGSIFFSSEARPAAEWAGHGRARPDHAGIAAYLTTIRTTLGSTTLFEGVRTLRPGEWALARPDGDCLRWRRTTVRPRDLRGPRAPLVQLLDQSVHAHLRSDVPLCCLLSGGLDSTAIATLAARRLPGLRTYCAGAADPASPRGEDFTWAQQVAQRLNLRHTEVPITRRDFAHAVPDLIQRLGVPLSTPNEVAIHAVASAMRADGFKVTLSGEGADELFGGYDHVLAAAANHEAICDPAFACPKDRARHSATFWMSSHAWVGESALRGILRPDAAEACRPDPVRACIESAFLEIEEETAESTGVPGALERHLRYQRRVNLEGLLRRFDTATMLAGVEGRTPFADAHLCAAAEDLPIADKIRLADRLGTATVGEPQDSKIALRRALAGVIPHGVLRRPKASFPLPFESWVADLAPRLMDSALVRALIRPEALDLIAADPSRHWRLAWPLVNLAVWGETLAAKAPGFVEATGDITADQLAA